MKTFEADNGYWNDGAVWVSEPGRLRRLLNARLDVVNKSPTGFAWGYEGSGPAQLAFAILAELIGTERASNPLIFQTFKRDVIARIPQNDGWQITETEIRDWLQAQEIIVE